MQFNGQQPAVVYQDKVYSNKRPTFSPTVAGGVYQNTGGNSQLIDFRPNVPKPNMGAYNTLQNFAAGSGQSPWASQMINQNQANYGQASQNMQNRIMSQGQGLTNSQAMGMGNRNPSSIQREAQKRAMFAKQQASRGLGDANLGVNLWDAQNRDKALGDVANLNIQYSQPQEFGINMAMRDLGMQNDYNQQVFNADMKRYGAGMTADAIANQKQPNMLSGIWDSVIGWG
jgi:hypothetical protein